MNQSETIGELAKALSKAQGELNGAAKSADNPFFKSKYADLYECIEAAKKPLADNGLAVIQTLDPAENGVDIITTLVHSSGEWIRGRIRMNPKKDDDQSRGSSITYGRRYSFAAIVGLAQKDDDGNASVNVENQKKTQTYEWLLNDVKVNSDSLDALNSWYKDYKSDIEKLPAPDKKKLLAEMTGIKNSLTGPETITCKETGNQVTAEDCRQSKCSSTFDKCKQ